MVQYSAPPVLDQREEVSRGNSTGQRGVPALPEAGAARLGGGVGGSPRTINGMLVPGLLLFLLLPLESWGQGKETQTDSLSGPESRGLESGPSVGNPSSSSAWLCSCGLGACWKVFSDLSLPSGQGWRWSTTCPADAKLSWSVVSTERSDSCWCSPEKRM